MPCALLTHSGSWRRHSTGWRRPQYRNQCVKDFKWDANGKTYKVAKTNDQDTWKIVQEDDDCTASADRCRSPGGEESELHADGITVGLFVTYVDNVLAIGKPEVLEGFCPNG